jgi:hypothetical protein
VQNNAAVGLQAHVRKLPRPPAHLVYEALSY